MRAYLDIDVPLHYHANPTRHRQPLSFPKGMKLIAKSAPFNYIAPYMAKQLNLFDFAGDQTTKRRYFRSAHGGGLSKGKRKDQRPLSRKKPLHLVLKSRQAVGAWSFLKPKNRVQIERILRKQSKKFGVILNDQANVGNHLHIKLKAHSRQGFQSFLRSITCLIARAVTGARRGHRLGRRFWDDLAFTRVIESFRDEVQLRGYFIANRLEGARGPAVRQRFLDRFNQWIMSRASTA